MLKFPELVVDGVKIGIHDDFNLKIQLCFPFRANKTDIGAGCRDQGSPRKRCTVTSGKREYSKKKLKI